jgi:hypothetical protein
MSQPALATAAFLDRILALLAPLFLAATGGDIEAARDAVRSTLASYQIRTDAELRLVALVIAFGFGALDALGKAASPELSLNQVMRLRSNATALSRAGHQNQAVLDRLRKQSPVAEPHPAEPDLPTSAETEDLITFARHIMQAGPRHASPLSRQQRRAAERAAEKARRQQEYQGRRAALLDPDMTRQ